MKPSDIALKVVASDHFRSAWCLTSTVYIVRVIFLTFNLKIFCDKIEIVLRQIAKIGFGVVLALSVRRHIS